MKKKNVLILMFFVLLMSSCVSLATFSVAIMNSSNMNKLELGMDRNQVISVLGSSYTIAEKRKEDDKVIEVLSYRDYYRPDEIYMFVFKNNSLERWYRVLLPQERVKTVIQDTSNK